MKNMTTRIVVALTLCVCASSALAEKTDPRAQKAGSLYQQGVIAMKAGKYDLARMSFKEVLKLYPTHPQSKRQLHYLDSNRSKLEVNNRKNSLQKIVIKKIDFDAVSAQEAIEILSAHVSKASPEDTKPNFIVQDRHGNFKGKTVTLNLNNVPADTLLRYILDQVGGSARYDKYAIVISPRHQSSAAK